MTHNKPGFHAFHYLIAWAVHLFTASAAFIGVLTIVKIVEGQFVFALWLMGATVVIDALDGTFARLVGVKKVLPSIDGALLDNLVDFVNYVVTPCCFLLIKPEMLPKSYALWAVFAITSASAYQFCQSDAKTPDHFFKGFPCYWNITLFYMFIFNTSPEINALILSILCILVFVPVKYVYPSRLDYLTDSKKLKVIMHVCSALYGVSAVFILLNYPNTNTFWLWLSLAYVLMYIALSFYRTYSPMIKAKIAANKDKNVS